MENKHSNFAATRETPMLATLVLSLELGARTGGAPVGLDLQSNSVSSGVEPLATAGSGRSTISAIFRDGLGALVGGYTSSDLILSISRSEETLTSPEKFPVEIVPQSKPPYDMIEK
ncbi:hypothetical protein Pint_14565 [Pistacia integerrima]|uniref:Uncharacterized protein n=1 Tax=Pistacia integerrima TaxID=434235 RepID=A0ACC0Y7B9_9ROSI|nr:hypothetical protein Pint_14565 [Pistacia integerrima]